VNVEGNTAGRDELTRLGVAHVPAVSVGERVVHGWNPAAYAALFGVDYRPKTRLSPSALHGRLDRILASAAALVERFPEVALAWTPPERDRTVRDLAYHVFRLSVGFVDAMEQGHLPHAWFEEGPPPDRSDARSIAAYGAEVRRRLSAWSSRATPDVYARTVQVYYGPQSSHDLLERTVWHAAQHLRQLYVLAERRGITPPAPLPVDAFEDLPLPASLW
jgi:DinB family protein